MTPVALAFAPFRPDLAEYNPAFTDAMMSVEPKPDGFGSLAGFDTFGDEVLLTEDGEPILTEDGETLGNSGLGAYCYGAVTTRQDNQTNRIYAGTLTKLFRFSAAGFSFTDVTRVSGDYTMTSSNWWSFAQFGGRLIACNGVDATQYITIESSDNFVPLPNAPIARVVATVGDFVVFGNLSTDPAAVQWSGINNSEEYTNGGSDIQSFADGGPVQNIVGHSTGAVIFQRDKIRLMEWRGDDLVFGFRVIQEKIGCFAPRSVVAARNTFFWYEDGGFFEGVNANPIGDDHVNRYVEQIFGPDGRQKLVGSVDPLRNMVWWTGTREDGSIRMLGYDYILGQWTQADTNAAFIFPAYTPGYTIDDLGTLGYTMDTIPYPFNSGFWVGTGELVLAGFDETGEFGYFQAVPMAATFETADTEFNQGGYAFLQSVRLKSDIPQSAITVQVGTRRFPGDDITWTDPVPVTDATGRSWHRRYGQTHRIRWNISRELWRNAMGATAYAVEAGNR